MQHAQGAPPRQNTHHQALGHTVRLDFRSKKDLDSLIVITLDLLDLGLHAPLTAGTVYPFFVVGEAFDGFDKAGAAVRLLIDG